MFLFQKLLLKNKYTVFSQLNLILESLNLDVQTGYGYGKIQTGFSALGFTGDV